MVLLEKILVKVICLQAIFLIGCSTDDEIEPPASIRDLENLTIFSDGLNQTRELELILDESFEDMDKIFLGRIGAIEVDDSGRVFLGDADENTVHVFRLDGSYLSQLGGEGSGPGELQIVGTMRIIDENLYVHDPIQQRMNVFSLKNLAFSNVINLEQPVNQDSFEEINGLISRSFIPKDDGTFLISFTPPKITQIDHPMYNVGHTTYRKFYLMDQEWRIVSDMLFKLKMANDLVASVGNEERFNRTQFSFLAGELISISDQDYIFTASTNDFLISMYNPDGVYIHAFYYPMHGKAINKEEILIMYENEDEWHRELIQHADLPPTWPVLDSMIADDEGRLWISTFTSEIGKIHWWVLNNTGELISSFVWPKDRSIVKVKNGYVYTRETDEMDFVSISRYRIQM